MSVEASERVLVLIADDDADILSLVRYKLERGGFQVLAAADGQAALDLAIEHAPTSPSSTW